MQVKSSYALPISGENRHNSYGKYTPGGYQIANVELAGAEIKLRQFNTNWAMVGTHLLGVDLGVFNVFGNFGTGQPVVDPPADIPRPSKIGRASCRERV